MDVPQINNVGTGISTEAGTRERLRREALLGHNWGTQMGIAGQFERERLQRAMSGDSVAQVQLRQGLGQLQNGIMAQASQGGTNPAAQRAAIQASAAAGQQHVGQAAMMRAQEVNAAEQNVSAFHQNAAAGHQNYSQLQLQRDTSQAQAQTAAEDLAFRKREADRALGMKIAGSALNMGAAALSDKRKKGGIENISGKEKDRTIRSLSLQAYNYDDDAVSRLGQTPERQHGIMAQHLQSTKAGSSSVAAMPDGTLIVDTPKAANLALGLAGRLGERLDRLEGAKKGRKRSKRGKRGR